LITGRLEAAHRQLKKIGIEIAPVRMTFGVQAGIGPAGSSNNGLFTLLLSIRNSSFVIRNYSLSDFFPEPTPCIRALHSNDSFRVSLRESDFTDSEEAADP
jgi:hypothetical protein